MSKREDPSTSSSTSVASPTGANAARDEGVQGLSTRLIHHPYRPPEGFESPVIGVHKASTVFFPNVAAMRSRSWLDRSGYTYGLHGTPTTFTLEARMASLEGARHAILAPSGLSAVTLVNQALLGHGEQLLLPDNVYQPNANFARHELKRWGVATAFYNAMNPASLAAALSPATRLVWLEAAGSVTLEFPDVRALVRTVRERAPKAVIALDNTWGAGIAFAPFDLGDGLGVDVSVQALTKYPSGGGDVLMGSVTCRDTGLHERLAMTHSRLGLGVSANDAELVLRSLPSIEMRYAHQDASTRRIAQWLTTQPTVARVLHPSLPGSPGHDAWRALCHDRAACLVSLQFAHGVEMSTVDRFVDALRLFRIGYSWAGPVSLVVPYDLSQIRPSTSAWSGPLVRLSIGMEDAQDLIADLERGLAAMG
jgi:cysteine-S-conjugate beta-lyase